MSKRLNYYQVHKNKKPKKRLENKIHPNVIKCIIIAHKIVNKAIETSQKLAISQQFKGEKKPEMITDKNGNQFTLSERTSINNQKIRESIALMGNYTPIIQEAAKNIKSVAEALSKLKNIQITKASN